MTAHGPDKTADQDQISLAALLMANLSHQPCALQHPAPSARVCLCMIRKGILGRLYCRRCCSSSRQPYMPFRAQALYQIFKTRKTLAFETYAYKEQGCIKFEYRWAHAHVHRVDCWGSGCGATRVPMRAEISDLLSHHVLRPCLSCASGLCCSAPD